MEENYILVHMNNMTAIKHQLKGWHNSLQRGINDYSLSMGQVSTAVSLGRGFQAPRILHWSDLSAQELNQGTEAWDPKCEQMGSSKREFAFENIATIMLISDSRRRNHLIFPLLFLTVFGVWLSACLPVLQFDYERFCKVHLEKIGVLFIDLFWLSQQ